MAQRRRPRAQSNQPKPGAARGLPVWVYAGVLLLAGVLVYVNGLSGPFIFDDPASIANNPHIQHLWPPTSALRTPSEGEPVAGRPLANLSLAIDYATSGLDVRGYHVTNLAIHLFCSLLLFGVIRRALLAPGFKGRFRDATATQLAFACALLWTVHPLHTEVIDYISARTESLMSAFYLLTIYAAIRANDGPLRRAWSAAAVGACALGMASKETMVTAPLMVLLFDRTFLFGTFKDAFGARRWLYLGLAATWLLLAALVSTGARGESAGFGTSVTPWQYLLSQPAILLHYLRLAVWPRSLVLDYGVPAPAAVRTVALDATLILALLLLTIAALIRWPLIGFLGAWFLVILAPTSSIIPIASEVGAESRMYLPLAAIIVAAVFGANALRKRANLSSYAGAAAFIVAFVALAVGTVSRNSEYESGVTIWRTVVARRPHERAHRNLALELKKAGYRDEVLAEWREVMRDRPDSRYELGRELFDQGRLDEAVTELRRFIAENPDDEVVLTARSLIAMAVSSQGKPADAAEQWREVLKKKPGDLNAEQSLADALLAQENYDAAAEGYQAILKAVPDDAPVWSNLGVALSATNHTAEAMAAFTKAVELNPADEKAHLGLAAALLQKRDVSGTIAHAREALRLTPDDPAAHTLLGLALLSQAKIDEATTEFQTALRLDPTDPTAQEYLRTAQKLRR